MRGLRTQEESKFKKFYQLVQESAKRKDSVFFLDAGDGNEFSTDEMSGENLLGWLIPEAEAKAFENVYESWGDIPDRWSDNYCAAKWENAESPSIWFE